MDHLSSSHTSAEPHPPKTRPKSSRRPYTPPAIVAVNRLETRAGTVLPPNLLDPINTPNQYGL